MSRQIETARMIIESVTSPLLDDGAYNEGWLPMHQDLTSRGYQFRGSGEKGALTYMNPQTKRTVTIRNDNSWVHAHSDGRQIKSGTGHEQLAGYLRRQATQQTRFALRHETDSRQIRFQRINQIKKKKLAPSTIPYVQHELPHDEKSAN